MAKLYHLNIEKSQIENAKIVLLPGDPFRTAEIADQINKQYGGEIKELAWKREFRTYLCVFNSKSILVTSTGIGGPSASIAIEELAMLGI
ncbi:MAG: nucleoside phosphorylase, partial [Planctomycetes bacterium]|nr:nucleoside phosphorylase [Planctomycetota bacterium]